jgi:hypothetical protein
MSVSLLGNGYSREARLYNLLTLRRHIFAGRTEAACWHQGPAEEAKRDVGVIQPPQGGGEWPGHIHDARALGDIESRTWHALRPFAYIAFSIMLQLVCDGRPTSASTEPQLVLPMSLIRQNDENSPCLLNCNRGPDMEASESGHLDDCHCEHETSTGQGSAWDDACRLVSLQLTIWGGDTSG